MDVSVTETAKKANIPRSTAYKMLNEFNESGGEEPLNLERIHRKAIWEGYLY